MCFHLNNDGKKTYHVKGAAMIRTPVSGRSVICSFFENYLQENSLNKLYK
jgi:hypothetical protein